MVSTLICRNVTVSGHRTSVRLESAMWDALHELCRREGKTAHAICSMVNRERHQSSLTAALRDYIMSYFRAAATEDGHLRAGHGRVQTAFAGEAHADDDAALEKRPRVSAYDPV
jgi:predicted DNA-binding ribbon-helix-helix protein